MSSEIPGEQVREFYRLQGVARERKRVLDAIGELQAGTEGFVFEALDWAARLVENGTDLRVPGEREAEIERILEAFRREQAEYQAAKKPFSGSVRFARAAAIIKGEQK